MHFHLAKTCDPHASRNCQPKQAYAGWAQQLWLTQLNQALGYKAEIEHFRRIRTDCSEAVPGCNMGRMYWQTNDIWQGASWASVDYTGRYKMVQYYVQKAYVPTLISADGNALHNTFSMAMINDNPYGHSHLTGEVKLTMWSWGSVTPLKSWLVLYDAPPASATNVTSSSFQAMLSAGGCTDATECLLTMAAFNGSAASGVLVSENYLLLAPFFDVTSMKAPRLNVTSVRPTKHYSTQPYENAFAVTVTAEAPAAFVWLETQYPGRWSDNGFVMTERSQTLTFFLDTSSHFHVPPDQLLRTTGTAAVGGGAGGGAGSTNLAPVGNVTALEIAHDLNNCRWQNPASPADAPKLVLHPGKGSLFSLADTSVEYTAGAP